MMAGRHEDVRPGVNAVGLHIASTASRCAAPGPRFHYWGEDPDNPAAEFFRCRNGFVARFPGIADFHVSADGLDVTCTPVLPDAGNWRATYAQQVVPLALSVQGQAVYHGGAVAVADGAVAFLGRSGQGKSTLVAACAVRGHAFLSDDCLILREDGQNGEVSREQAQAWAIPDADFIRLWPDSVQGHATVPGRASTHPGSPKPRLHSDPDALPYCDVPKPVRRVFVLAEPGEMRTTRLSPSEATMAWAGNAFLLDLKSPQALRRNLARAARLAATIPVYRLEYPRRYDLLDELVRCVVSQVDATVPG